MGRAALLSSPARPSSAHSWRRLLLRPRSAGLPPPPAPPSNFSLAMPPPHVGPRVCGEESQPPGSRPAAGRQLRHSTVPTQSDARLGGGTWDLLWPLRHSPAWRNRHHTQPSRVPTQALGACAELALLGLEGCGGEAGSGSGRRPPAMTLVLPPNPNLQPLLLQQGLSWPGSCAPHFFTQHLVPCVCCKVLARPFDDLLTLDSLSFSDHPPPPRGWGAENSSLLGFPGFWTV